MAGSPARPSSPSPNRDPRNRHHAHRGRPSWPPPTCILRAAHPAGTDLPPGEHRNRTPPAREGPPAHRRSSAETRRRIGDVEKRPAHETADERGCPVRVDTPTVQPPQAWRSSTARRAAPRLRRATATTVAGFPTACQSGVAAVPMRTVGPDSREGTWQCRGAMGWGGGGGGGGGGVSRDMGRHDPAQTGRGSAETATTRGLTLPQSGVGRAGRCRQVIRLFRRSRSMRFGSGTVVNRMTASPGSSPTYSAPLRNSVMALAPRGLRRRA